MRLNKIILVILLIANVVACKSQLVKEKSPFSICNHQPGKEIMPEKSAEHYLFGAKTGWETDLRKDI
jgi:beta-lactamase class D